MIRSAAAIVLSLACTAVIACDRTSPADPDCITGTWGVFLPKDQGRPAPNIELRNFQHQSPDDRFGQGIAHEELMRLHEKVKQMCASAFSGSRSSFELALRYTLTTDKPATFEMRTTGREAEKEQLTNFYKQAAEFVDFHSRRGTVYVLFYYSITPASAAASGK